MRAPNTAALMTMTTTPENLTTKEIKISMRNETNVESEMEWSGEKERERGQQKKKLMRIYIANICPKFNLHNKME